MNINKLNGFGYFFCYFFVGLFFYCFNFSVKQFLNGKSHSQNRMVLNAFPNMKRQSVNL